MLLDSLEFACPWCGVSNSVECEPGDAGQQLIQDCRNCCSPIEIRLPAWDGDALQIAREGG